jgi:hypothetical protein
MNLRLLHVFPQLHSAIGFKSVNIILLGEWFIQSSNVLIIENAKKEEITLSSEKFTVPGVGGT